MLRKRPSPTPPATPCPNPPCGVVDNNLTPAQREFACLLGRLLAELWCQEHEAPVNPLQTRRGGCVPDH
jgi:hypothetical protein